MTHPGVGPVTALATEVFLGDPSRFADAKAVASYVGMIPSEYSSGDRQRLGKLTKQGNPLLRFLWCEAAIHAVRRDAALGPLLSTQTAAERTRQSARRRGAQAGHPALDSVTRSDRLRGVLPSRAITSDGAVRPVCGDACVEMWSGRS